MASPSSPWRDSSASTSVLPAMEHSTAATPSRHSKYSIPRSRRISNNELPLIHCEHCKCRLLKVLTAKTPKNYDRRFYVCPTRTRDGGGCQFWEWEEGYEQYLVDNKLVPPDYQPVFESTKLPQQVSIIDNKPNRGESRQKEQVKLLREIVLLLKCLLLICGLVLVSIMYAIIKSG
ncbi:hypothetical protein BDA96_02G096200 [Sorghum bicolor]|uniref:GRF-type domain-containing protein n=2 Tax=Sorghum bicolor TaxID=4558 RepID=A0A921US99_SORBI|nr:hypothetical protein BDA96_02G096200 [Sorghum bicolor]OQU88771.1 hypothetical protein SORBI_3002G093150 [Sorghum bicolor]